MSSAAQIINEQDDTGQDDGPSLQPVRQPSLRTVAPTAPEERYEIVEVDERGQQGQPQALPDDGQQVQQPAPQAGADDGEGDQSLAAENVGQQPLIQTDAQGRQVSRSKLRRQRQQQGRNLDLEEKRRQAGEIAALREQLEAMQAGLGQVQPQLAQIGEARLRDRLTSLDVELGQINREYNAAVGEVFRTIQASDEAGAGTALDRRDQLALRRFQIGAEKTQINATLQQVGAGQQPNAAAPQQDFRLAPRQAAPQARQDAYAPLPARVQGYVNDFTSEHPWYNPSGGDIDSDIVLALDKDVATRFDPGTSEYWDELNDLMAERLPHRFADPVAQAPPKPRAQAQTRLAPANAQQPQPRQQVAPQRRGPMVAGGGEMNGAGGKPTQVVITPARKDSLIEMGVVGSDGGIRDKPKFQRMLKQYAEYDRANQAAR